MDIAETLVEHHVELINDLISHAAELDDEILDAVQPTPPGELDAETTIRVLLTMMVGQLEVWLALAEGKQSSDVVPRSMQELGRRHREVGLQFVELTRRVVREGRVAEVFRPGTTQHPDIFTYGGMIAQVLTFGAIRRAIVISALEAAGVTGLRYGDPMVYFADHGH